MLEFHRLYHPVTSRRGVSDQTYREFTPCETLMPYIACYWIMRGNAGTERKKTGTLVIPDTCMDIIVKLDRKKGRVSGSLCGMWDRPFVSGGDTVRSEGEEYFCIRFYFWSAHLFFRRNFAEVCNGYADLEDLGREWVRMFQVMMELETVEEKIFWAEQFLVEKAGQVELHPDFFNTTEQILKSKGRMSVRELCGFACVSQRQMERLFRKTTGLSIKKMSGLVRYQNVWKNLTLDPGFDVQDAVYRYGYTDESHLLKEFRKFHGLSPGEAKQVAENGGRVSLFYNTDRP